MKWYVKRKTLAWIAILIGLVLWGQLNGWLYATENEGQGASISNKVTWTSESVAYITNRTKRISETFLYIKDRVARSPTPVTESTSRRLPKFPKEPESQRVSPPSMEPDVRLQPSSQSESDTVSYYQSFTTTTNRVKIGYGELYISLPPPPSTESKSDTVEVGGRLRVSRRKALLYGKPRATKSYLTIGIPTLRRHGVDYLEKTLYSLITHSTTSQQMSMVVIIFMVDRNQTWTKIRSKQLAGKYPRFIKNGFLQIVHPHDQSIYPDFTKLKRTYNDSAKRVAWRSKQNIDYAYLFLYSENISRYYLHLEDDVIAAGNYYNDIVNFIESKFHTFWYYLEFSHIGFIGKLLRSSDLLDLSDYMMMFFAEQPCDLLLLALGKIKTQSRRITISRSVFQHIGVVSSLTGKIQNITDRHFKDSLNYKSKRHSLKKFNHVNPSANIVTDIEVYSDHKPMYAYDLSDNYFFGISPKKGRYFRVVFDAPQNISHVYIYSGTEGKRSDVLHDANLLVSTSGDRQEPCKQLTCVTNFTNGNVDTKNSNISLPANIDCVAIDITADHKGWIVISEITIFLPGEVETLKPVSTSPSKNFSKDYMMTGKQERSFKPYSSHGTSNNLRHSGQHTVSNGLIQSNLHRSNESQTWKSPMSYESVNVNTSNSSVQHFETERDGNHSSQKNKEEMSRQYPVKQQYDNVQQNDATWIKFNSTGINAFSRKKFHHVNPPATIYTQIETYSNYKPMYAYDSSSELYFWGVYPKNGDYFLVLLNIPQNISRVFIDTGYVGKESDILYSARLLVSSRVPGEEERRCHRLEDVGTFQNGDIDTAIPSTYINIDCFVVEITANQRNWIIIREIAVFLSGESETIDLDNDVKFPHMRNESNAFEERILNRNETSNLLSKLSNKPFKDNGLALLSPQQQYQPRLTNRSSLFPHQPKEGFLPDLPLNGQQTQKIKIRDLNITENDESLNMYNVRGGRNISKNKRRKTMYQQISDNKINNTEIIHSQPTISSRLLHYDTKLLKSTIARRDNVSVPTWQTTIVKSVKHRHEINRNTTSVKQIREINKRFNFTVEQLYEQNNDDEQRKKPKNRTKLKRMNKFSKKRFHHYNPAATVYTEIETFSGYLPEYAYDLSDKYFWGCCPKQGDYFLVLFHSPQNISHIFIKSGHLERQSDMLHSARLLVSTGVSGKDAKPCHNFEDVANFVHGDVDTKASNISLPINIDCIVIEVLANQKNWLIIREIAVFLWREPEPDKDTRSLSFQNNIITEKQVLERRKGELKPTIVSHSVVSASGGYSGYHLANNKNKGRQQFPNNTGRHQRRLVKRKRNN